MCTTVCKWTYLGHAHMQHIDENNSRDMEANGWDDDFWEEIGLGDLVDGHHSKIGKILIIDSRGGFSIQLILVMFIFKGSNWLR